MVRTLNLMNTTIMTKDLEGVKKGVSKLEGATQSGGFWGQIWGQKAGGGRFWGITFAAIFRYCLMQQKSNSLILI